MNNSHKWKFFRAGGFDQVKLETGADLMSLHELDKKLWVALACPTTGLNFDPKTAAMIDTDKDGRVRADELVGAVKWAGGLLKNADDLVKGLDPLPLSAVNDATPEGKQILSSAKTILANLGKKDATAISVEDLVDTNKIFAQTAFNGDGVIVEDSATDEDTKAAIRDIIAIMGAETDRSGKPGTNQPKVDKFFAEANAFSDWWKKAEGDKTVMPAADATAAAAAAWRAVKAKIDDYFTRCRLAAFDARSAAALNRDEKDYLVLTTKDLNTGSPEIAGLPLAKVDAGRPLPLKDGLNPAWEAAVSAFADATVKPLLGEKSSLTEAEWSALQAKLAPFEAWNASKAGAMVEKLGLPRVRAILGSKAKDTITALIAKDKAEEGNANSIAVVEKLVLFVRDLSLLCVNFVNFKDFYDRGEPAIFQAGTLYLDQRSCELTLPVQDAGKHSTMAGLAGAYLAYCDCTRKGSGEKMSIVAIFSQGDDDNLMVGRNGIFYDRKGKDWDATITKIVSNPISLRQAFWLPYKKLVRMIEEQVTKRAAAAEADSTAKMQEAALKVAEADKAAAKPAPAPAKKVDVGTVAALGVAFGAVGSFVATIFAHVMGLVALGPLAIIGGLIGVILLISGPSMILAYIKLRKRNLGPILDANGWAVNARAKINVPFGTSLTGIAKLPPGAERDMTDPFAEKKRPWGLYITIVVIVTLAFCWYKGKLDSSLPAKIKSTTVLGTNAPAYVPPVVTPATAPAPAAAPAPEAK
jgi:hypothetical protein